MMWDERLGANQPLPRVTLVNLMSNAVLILLVVMATSSDMFCSCDGFNTHEVESGHDSLLFAPESNCNTGRDGLCAHRSMDSGITREGSGTASPDILALKIPELDQKHVHIKDPERVAKIIKQMMDDAHHKLQVVADFDRTLSKYAHEGQVCSTTHGVLEDSDHMPEEFKVKARKLKDTYLPIEFDGTKTIAEKIPHMIEWWTNGHALITNSHLTRDLLRTIVRDSSSHLRDGCTWFFEQLHKHEIPLLIFSAGLGDIITEVVSHQAVLYDNMKIVSNFLDFDETGKVVGFVGNMIHVYNKNEHAVHSSDYFENIKHRENLMLLGDSLGDLRMAEGAEDVVCLLKVGFLNFKVEENLEQYKESYDIVIVQDQSMAVVNSLMTKILGQS